MKQKPRQLTSGRGRADGVAAISGAVSAVLVVSVSAVLVPCASVAL